MRSNNYAGLVAMFAGLFAMNAQAGQPIVNSGTSLEGKAKKQEVAGIGTYSSNKKKKALLAGHVSPHKRQGLILDNQRKLRQHLRSNPTQRRKYAK